jgi:hypothetical protein
MAQPGVTTGSAETLPVVETSTGNGGSTSPNGGTAALPPLAATAIASINPEAFDEGTVYSWASRDVVPPVMLQPRMPRSAFPEFDEEVTGPFVEVLVNEQGGVDAVRLRGRMDQGEAVRYGMMLSAAKAWQFQAAHRGGRTVRYVVRVLITP